MTCWVVDSSPLLFLAKIDQLDLLRAGRVIAVPPAVVREVSALRDDACETLNAAFASWIRVEGVLDSEILRLLRFSLGDGEAETLALASARRAARVVLDDQDARRFARRLGLPVIGTLGVLLAAHKTGLISDLATEIRRLEFAGFYARPELIDAVLREAKDDSRAR